MRFLIRPFFKILRMVLGPVMLLLEIVRRPHALIRQPALQAGVDLQCRDLALYQYRTCPFCIKVRQEMHRLSLKIERRDAQADATNRADLVRGCGLAKVPCLRIAEADGAVRWLTDSNTIIAYLRGRFAAV